MRLRLAFVILESRRLLSFPQIAHADADLRGQWFSNSSTIETFDNFTSSSGEVFLRTFIELQYSLTSYETIAWKAPGRTALTSFILKRMFITAFQSFRVTYFIKFPCLLPR